MLITLSKNLSYCFGVKRTLTLVEKLMQENPQNSYSMLGEIVHNEHVIQDLKNKGLRIIHDLDQVETGANVIIQSHGVPLEIYDQLKQRQIEVIDATCPMVKLIHDKIIALEEQGFFPVIIGKKGHDEVKGIAGQVSRTIIIRNADEVTEDLFKNIPRVGIVLQSTFIREEALKIVEKIKAIVPEVKFEDTICKPTTDRQKEVRCIPEEYDWILIIGSKTSANTLHLYKLANLHQAHVVLIDDPKNVKDLNIPQDAAVFIASGASTPQYMIKKVVANLKEKAELDKKEM